MEKTYFSVDIESSGPTPAEYSMLSFGCCVVGNTDKTFYRELKPISKRLVLPAMRVASQNLSCLQDVEYCDPNKPNFKPELVLEELDSRGIHPREAMLDFRSWVSSETNGRAVLVASPLDFDGMFIRYYLDNFGIRSPFHHGGEDIQSMYRGLVRNPNASIKDSPTWPKDGLPHNALEDAIIQAKVFEYILSKF
jgi:hypothetical protein